ncbi:probable G-protein coupled receptor Mth-like 1 [Drosophila sulfurigaster albostrigata]|uniref:probable G-protein coupled receptor Mth-like 1 n=1 Tax=Drosophila sulfurigaster albostrigata TaxID=89887 RepID=UPI002D21B374|nr:probable G-protein coupled receptor Mth-like 1 [Drosophila sulfurigaster albostrigata]
MQSFWLLMLIAQLVCSQEAITTTEDTLTISSTSTTASVTNGDRLQPPPRVTLNKCCHGGEYLNSSSRICVAGASKDWVPLVFLIQQRRFFEPEGSKPRFVKFVPNVQPQCDEQHQQLELFHTRSANVLIFSNGTLSVRERDILVQPANYCVDRFVALVCVERDAPLPMQQQERQPGDESQQVAPPPPPPTLRLRKCCGKRGIYNSNIKSCTLQTAASGSSDANGQLQLEPQLPWGSYQTSYGLPECHLGNGSAYAIAGDWHEATLNRTTGALQLQLTNLSALQYCLEHTERAGEVKIITCSQHFGQDTNQAQYADDVSILSVGIVISIVFLAATLVAGYMLPAVHHALHWRCQIYYVFCLLLGKILLIVEISRALEPGTMSCMLLAIGMQFFFLSAFFWLNTMCFNIWWTFRDFRPSSLERNQETLRLRLYSAYAWGVPLLICAIAACVDQLPETETALLRTGFGQPYCWFDNRAAIFAYFFGPIGLLLCANIMLFISTTHQLTCGLWKRDDVKSTSEKSALGRVCLKLVVVMGVTWIWDIISWLVGGPNEVWLMTDLINALQGVFIFIVVGCQPQVWTACKRICCPRLTHDITNTTNGVQHSSSSQGLPSMAGCGTEFTQNTSMNVTTLASPDDSAPAVPTSSPPRTPTLSIANTTTATTGATTTTTKIPMETIC